VSPSREEALLALALAKPESLRASWLDRECEGDAALRQRVEALLAARQERGGVPSSLRLNLAGFPPDETIGTMLGRYKLLEKLGEGGCGAVYVAEQTEPVRRRVALKVIKLGMDTREVIARFEAERQALAMMDHPNIAKILDAGVTGSTHFRAERDQPIPAPDEGREAGVEASTPPQISDLKSQISPGRPYFVMELVRGTRITDYCDQNRLSTRERLDLFIQVCQAIQHAHQKGIIHRDIKPSNILVTLHDGVPVPKVIDFGIAKAIEGRLTDATVYTQFHHFIGTPAYMSPEQAEMSGLDVDTRSDIYALGVLLYELLTGRTPFDAQELIAKGVDAMRKTIREQEPVWPSSRVATLEGAERTTTAARRSADPPKLAHLLQGDLDWIVMKCLEKNRTRRYETANGLAADIKRHLAHEPVLARPPSAAYRFQKSFRRHRVAFLAASAVAIMLVLGLAGSLWQAIRATRAEDLASKRLTEAEAVSGFLTDVFQRPDPARDGRTVTVAETLDTAVQRLDSDLAGQPARRAQLQATLGRTYVALGLAGEAIPLLRKALDHHLATVGPDHRDALLVMHHLGQAYIEARRFDDAIRVQTDLLERRRRVTGPESREAILSMMDLANALAAARHEEEALELHQTALRLSRKVNGPEHPDTIRAMFSLALSSSHTEALPLLEEARALSRRVNGPQHPSTFRVAYNLQRSYAALGRDEDSLKLLEELAPLSVKINGFEHPFTRRVLSELERGYYAAGRWQDAVQLKADYARWNPKDLNAELLVVQAWFGRDADYAASCRRLLKFAEGTQVPTTAERAAKACLLRPLADPEVLDQAYALARRAVDLGADHQFYGWFQYALGVAEYRRGNFRAADKALLASERMAPLNSRFFRAMSLVRQGQPSEARRLFTEAVSQMRPLPDEDQNPLAGGASGDDMIVWLAYKEAKEVLGVEDSGSPSVGAWIEKLQASAASRPDDTILSMRLALVLLWSGRTADHETLCRELLTSTADSSDPLLHDRAAKAYLLRSDPEPKTLGLAAASAGRALELAATGDPNLPWFRTVAGMAAFREKRFSEAETLLTKAIKSPLHENQRLLALAFRAMTRWDSDRRNDARADLAELGRVNLTLPEPTRMSAVLRDQDQLAVRLAQAEAKSRLKERPPAEASERP
jgi:serine/threonine protein kinase